MTCLAILDPSLQSFNGHFLTYDNAVSDGVAKLGLQTKMFAAREVNPDLTVHGELIPAFRDPLEKNFIQSPLGGMLPFMARVNTRLLQNRFLEDMNRKVTGERIGQNPVLFLHTTTYRQIPPLVDWTARNKHLSPTVIILLRYAPSPNPYYPNTSDAGGYKKALDYIVDRGMQKYIRLVTDSDILADEYHLMTSLPITVLPIPHTAHTVSIPPAGAPALISYLGNARATKGFQYLPYVVDVIKDELEKGTWRAEFQANVMFGRDTESVNAVQLLRQRNVILHENELSPMHYNDLLSRSSLVVIPYQVLYYYAQTSGVLCEALAAGKAVVVPRGTWMSRQIKDKGVGETFLPGDRVSLGQAVQRAMKNINGLMEKTRAMREEWVQYHSPDNFAAALARLL